MAPSPTITLNGAQSGATSGSSNFGLGGGGGNGIKTKTNQNNKLDTSDLSRTTSHSSALPARKSSSASSINDPRKFRTQSALRAHLASLTARETELSIALNELISHREDLDTTVEKLHKLVPRVQKLGRQVDGDSTAESGGGGVGMGKRRQSGNHMVNGNSTGIGNGSDFDYEYGRGIDPLSAQSELVQERLHDFDDFDQAEESLGLVNRVTRVWCTSERVGGKVQKLDNEVSRVKESAERVSEVLELKLALSNLREAIPKNDWEVATRCCRRAMDLREDVITGPFAARVIPSSDDPHPPPQALDELRNTLLETFKERFKDAAEKKDEQNTSRFFKLFPMIGAEEQGLEVYGDFVVGLVKGRSPMGGKPSSPLFYISHLTALLESIALIIDQHQNVVDKYYGSGKMIRVVDRLQREADRVVRNLVEGWEEERRVGRLISETRQTSFAYLNNPVGSQTQGQASHHGTGPGTGLGIGIGIGTGAAVSSSLAALSQAQQNLASHIPSAASTLLANYAGTRRGQQPEQQGARASHDEPTAPFVPDGPDPRDVDRVLGEMIALSGRWALYRRFVWNRLVEGESDEEGEEEDGDERRQDEQQRDREGALVSSPSSSSSSSSSSASTSSLSPVLRILNNSDSQKAVDHMMRTYYEPLEAWYLRTSIEKAHKLDVPDLSSRPYLSSVVDDVFYLLKLVSTRLFSTGFLSTLISMRETLVQIIERDYLGVLQKKMDAVYSGGGAALTLPSLPGQSREAERERKERDLRTSYSVLLNDLDQSAQYMDLLIEDLLGNDTILQSWLDVDLETVQEEIRKFSDLSTRMRSMAKSGIEQIFNQLTRPRLRMLLEDSYKGVSYLLDEDGYNEADVDDLVRKRFISGWEPLMSGYKCSLTDGNFQHFFLTTVEVLVRPWEKMVLGMRFTELGAIRFDRDVRAVANFLSTQSDFGGARDKFTRLQQISTVLNLDADEDPEDFYSSSGIPWRLSKVEYNNIVALRA